MQLAPSPVTRWINIGFVMSIALGFPLVVYPCRVSVNSLLFRRVSGAPDRRTGLGGLSAVTHGCDVFVCFLPQGRRHGFLSGGRIVGSVTNLPPKCPKNRKRHRIWTTSFSNLEGTSPPNFSLRVARPLRPPPPCFRHP